MASDNVQWTVLVLTSVSSDLSFGPQLLICLAAIDPMDFHLDSMIWSGEYFTPSFSTDMFDNTSSETRLSAPELSPYSSTLHSIEPAGDTVGIDNTYVGMDTDIEKQDLQIR